MINRNTKLDESRLFWNFLQLYFIMWKLNYYGFILSCWAFAKYRIIIVPPTLVPSERKIFMIVVFKRYGHRKSCAIRAKGLNVKQQSKFIQLTWIYLKLISDITSYWSSRSILDVSSRCRMRILGFSQLTFLLLPFFYLKIIMRLKLPITLHFYNKYLQLNDH